MAEILGRFVSNNQIFSHRYPNSQFILYTGDTDAPEEILARTKQLFNIVLPYPVEFVYLHRRKFVEEGSYPYFTLLGQSLGSIYLGLEALFKFVPGNKIL
jgi:alpha-1,2-mannosyltransferase